MTLAGFKKSLISSFLSFKQKKNQPIYHYQTKKIWFKPIKAINKNLWISKSRNQFIKISNTNVNYFQSF